MKIRLLLCLLCSCTLLSAQQKILFVGNSLTYYNDLPKLVKEIAKQNGIKLDVHSFTKPNYALEDHWIEGAVVAELRSTHYDFIVFQQGPSALKASRENLIEYALMFSKVCKEQNSRMAFYSVWPSGDRSFDFENVYRSYSAAADTTHGIVCPAGNAWLKVWEGKKDFPLYSEDGFHPTEHGSLLAALVIYGSLFKRTSFEFIEFNKLSLQFVTHQHFELLKKAATASLTEQ
jgi:hypothetical protein